MGFSAIVTMLVGLGITWGGAALCLRLALRKRNN